MSDYSKSFLLEDGRKREPGAKIWLAAFGKHPGWNDHVEDLGLETQSLILAKMILYVQGIGGQIDAGAWEKLDASQQMAGFNHVFLWRRGAQFLLGKMWSSSDGKGRTRYPMILCLQCAGAPLGWALRNILPQLDEIQRKCAATASADEVKSILARATSDLRSRVLTVSPETDISLAERKAFVDSPSLGPDRQGLCRVVHQISSQMSAYSRDASATKASDLRPQQIRLPRGIDSVPQSLLLWDQVFQIMLAPGAPMLLVASLDQPWVDATVGEPATHEFFCLRASDKNIPPASAIPYNLDESIKRRTQQIVDTLLGNSAKKPPVEPDGPKSGPVSSITSFFTKAKAKWLVIVIAVCLLLGIVAVMETGHQGGAPPADRAAQAKSAAEVQAHDDSRLAAEKEKLAAESKAKADAAAKSNAIAQSAVEQTRLATEARARAEADAKAAEEARWVAEAKARAEAEAKASDDARLKAEQEQLQLAAAAKARADADARAADDARMKAAQEQLLAQAKAKADQEQLALVARPPESPPPVQPKAPASIQNASTAGGPIPLENSAAIKFVWVAGVPGVKGPAGVGACEITEEQYADVMQFNPSRVKLGPKFPVDSVSGFDATNFCAKLTDREHARHTLDTNWKYALPTEEQWKYFARGTEVTESITSKGRPVSRVQSEPVGEMKANSFGLYDVIGNVWEWCVGTDGILVPKGGGYEGRFTNGIMADLSLETRGRIGPGESSPNVGFRIMVVPVSL